MTSWRCLTIAVGMLCLGACHDKATSTNADSEMMNSASLEPDATPAIREARMDPAKSARKAAAAVGSATRTEVGFTGDPVYVLPENHNSRLGQIDEALMLYRLNREKPLAGIVLE